MSKYVKDPEGFVYAYHDGLAPLGWPFCELDGTLIGRAPVEGEPQGEKPLSEMTLDELKEYMAAKFGAAVDTEPAPSEKALADMTVAELKEYAAAKFGIAVNGTKAEILDAIAEAEAAAEKAL